MSLVRPLVHYGGQEGRTGVDEDDIDLVENAEENENHVGGVHVLEHQRHAVDDLDGPRRLEVWHLCKPPLPTFSSNSFFEAGSFMIQGNSSPIWKLNISYRILDAGSLPAASWKSILFVITRVPCSRREA